MYRLIIFCVLSLLVLNVNAQEDSLFKHINNETVSFNIIMTGAKFKGGVMYPAKYLVRVINPEKDTLVLKKITPEKWIEALNNPETDWAANLLLYELYRKGALFMLHFKRSDWIAKIKEEDIAYWTDLLEAK